MRDCQRSTMSALGFLPSRFASIQAENEVGSEDEDRDTDGMGKFFIGKTEYQWILRLTLSNRDAESLCI